MEGSQTTPDPRKYVRVTEDLRQKIGRRGDKVYHNESAAASFDPLALKFTRSKKLEDISVREALGLDKIPGDLADGDFLGYQLVRMNRQGGAWRADNNSVYESILYPLAKAWSHFVQEREDDRNERSEQLDFRGFAVGGAA
jgi:hypothetical protein